MLLISFENTLKKFEEISMFGLFWMGKVVVSLWALD